MKWAYAGMIAAVVFLLVLVLIWDRYYLQFSLLIIVLAMAPFFVRFERKPVAAEEIVLIGMMAAIAAVSRVPFGGIPSVQPTSFVIIMAGLVFGAETGFMVGCAAALVSNMVMGQGPWTPWQMFGWGMMGCTAGLLNQWKWMQTRPGWIVFGGLWGFLFGWLMNLWAIFGFYREINLSVFIASYLSSFSHDLTHALSNVFFLLVFGNSWMKILRRIQRKYGLLK